MATLTAALLKTYPWMDHLMAETLVKAHENGTLATQAESWPEHVPQPMGSEVVVGAVAVEAPVENSPRE